jgi:flagellar motor switch protein FliM
MLNATPDDSVELKCGDIPMFQGRMGRKGGSIAVRIDRETPKPEEVPG